MQTSSYGSVSALNNYRHLARKHTFPTLEILIVATSRITICTIQRHAPRR